ncbi:hypothetical protein CHY_1771 [Carboxydothermus hydrogenoformans Z-2901]|uniref:Uncharacterized protein n=1 Tax=Carboxydothermus hydrogenoformans (strain ATCC BAA-161 / DSM 6008 / Z-2901) TaxID=246194 RepID=Q3AB93_CARHZ|nr:hypothetical protein CHY_1771 [Carboxydothermus hydrogenoformans Z-2901]
MCYNVKEIKAFSQKEWVFPLFLVSNSSLREKY